MTQQIHSHTFENGLVLAAEPMPWLESAALTLLVPAGCGYDPPGRAGLAGFTCEMVLRGAGERDSHQIINDLDRLGVERGEGISDAHTSFTAATLADHLLAALPILADIVRRPHLPPGQLEAARHLVLHELAAVEDEPAQKLMLELRRHHYPPPWGNPATGDETGLQAVAIDDVRRHVERLYRPNGTILGVAGRCDWPALRDLVGELFGDWAPVDVPTLADGAPVARREHLPDETNQTQIGVAYPSVPYRHPEYFSAWGAVGALSGGMSSRLFTEVREKRGLCYSVYASYHSLRHLGSVLCYAGTTADRAQETLDVLLAELKRLADGIEQREVDRLKARIKSALIMQQESSGSRSATIARDWYHLGRVRLLEEVGRKVDELSSQVINDYLTRNPPEDFTVVTLGPQPLEVPVGIP